MKPDNDIKRIIHILNNNTGIEHVYANESLAAVDTFWFGMEGVGYIYWEEEEMIWREK